MATLEKIRGKGPLLVAVIGIALLAFIIGDFLNSGVTYFNRSRENVQKVVRKIVSERMGLGQFDECEITIKEINIIIHTVVNNFTGIYHSRVEYPKVSLEGLDKDEG